MHIESVPNRKSHPTILLRESYRADGKVRKRTIANLTHWPEPGGGAAHAEVDPDLRTRGLVGAGVVPSC